MSCYAIYQREFHVVRGTQHSLSITHFGIIAAFFNTINSVNYANLRTKNTTSP